MKLYGNTKVLIPWFDTNGNKNWSTLTFTGDVDRRRVYREIARFARVFLGRTVSKRWILEVPLIVNKYDKPMEIPEEDYNQFLEEFIRRIEYREDEDEGYTEGQSEAAQGAEGQVRPLRNELN